MNDPFDLTGKVAVVTGGRQGLGEAIAIGLAMRNATVVIVDLEQSATSGTAERINLQLPEPRVTALAGDVRDQEQATATLGAIQESHGTVDILVNNAGIHRRVDPLDFDAEDLDAILDVNLRGSFFMAAAAGRVMKEQGQGSLINISALGGGMMGLGRSGSAYAMSKGALVALTRDLAAEWGKFGIRVNALAPGWIRTPMTAALQANAERSAAVLQRVPLARWGEATDVAGAAVFLASDASRYITGLTIPVDGGAANTIMLD